MNRIDVGIEIGSSKVCVAVGEKKPGGGLRILGIGEAPSRGVRVGEIVDMEMARESVRNAVANAEQQSDVLIESVRVAVTGAHFSSFNRRSAITLAKSRSVIEEDDCRTVRESACFVMLPEHHVLLHTILQHYDLDGRRDVPDPVGMSGRRLEAVYHLVHGMKERIQTSIRCIKELNLEAGEAVFAPIASAQAVLDQAQKKAGALVIDIGAGTTGYTVYCDGELRQSGVVNAGGALISYDIASFHNMPFALAEKLKIEHGSALRGNHPPGEKIMIEPGPGFAGREIDREKLNIVIHMRARDMLNLLKRRLAEQPHLNSVSAGIFLTGGTSLLKGIRPLAQDIFGMPVLLAHERTDAGLDTEFGNPRYSTAIGLLFDA